MRYSVFSRSLASAYLVVTLFVPLGASIPASYDRLFREQENHIQSLEEQMTALSLELDKERSQSVQLQGVSEKYNGISASYDKLKLVKMKLQKELKKSRGQLKDLKKYYMVEQKESDLREKRMLKASSRLSETLRQREAQIDGLEKSILTMTKELKDTQVKHTKLSREFLAKIESNKSERDRYKFELKKLQSELLVTHRNASIKGQELEQSLHQNQALSEKIENMKTMITASQTEAEKTFNTRIEALQKRFKTAQNEIEAERLRRVDVEGELASFERKTDATDAILQSALKEKNVLAERYDQLKQNMVETVEKHETQVAQCLEMQHQIVTLTAQNEFCQKEIATLTKNVDLMASQKDDLMQKNNELHNDLVESKNRYIAENTALKKDVENLAHTVDMVSKESAKVKEERTTLAQLTKELSETNDGLRGEHKQATDLVASVTAEIAKIKEDNKHLKQHASDVVKDNKVLLARKKNFDSIMESKEQECARLMTIKSNLEEDITGLKQSLSDVVAENDRSEQDRFNATKVADLSEQLQHTNESLEKVRQMLASEKQYSAQRVQGYKAQLSELSGELHQLRVEYGETEQELAMAKQAEWRSGKDMRSKHNAVMVKLHETEESYNESQKKTAQLQAQLEEKNKMIEVMKSKTSELLASIGLGGSQDRGSQKTAYFKKLLERELAELSVKDLEDERIDFSAGLRSLLSDSRLIGNLIDELGSQAESGSKEGVQRCEHLHKVFLARKQMASGDLKAERELDQMFKMYAKFASKQLGDKKLAQLSIKDIGQSDNGLAAKIAEQLTT